MNQPSPGLWCWPPFALSHPRVCVCVCGARVCASNRSSTDHWHTRTGGTTESRRRRPGVDDHVLPPSRRDFVRVKRALQRPPNEISPSGRGSGGSRLKSPVVRPLTDCRRRVLAASVTSTRWLLVGVPRSEGPKPAALQCLSSAMCEH